MQWWVVALVALGSYLLGSVNGSLLISRVFLKVDIRDYGSGNAGTTNALRVMGKKWAVAVTLIDLCKGALAVLFGYCLLQETGAADFGKLLAGVFAITGHIFPVFFRFRGGKGVMTTAAIIAFVDWRVFVVAMAVFFVVVLLTRWVSLGSILAASGIPVGMYLFHMGEGRDAVLLTALSAVFTLMIVVMHRDNIKRILSGDERRFSWKGRALLSSVKTKTADLSHRTAGAIRKTSKRLRTGASGLTDRRKNRKISKRKLRKARRTGRMSRLGKRPQKQHRLRQTKDRRRGKIRHTI